jgi:hypothetical protein
MRLPLKRFALSAAIAAAASVLVSGRQRPDFTGSWVATKDAPAGIAAAPSPVFGERFAIKHTGQKLELFRPSSRPEPWVTTHPLDGTETRVGLPAGTCFGQSGQLVTTAWNGDAIAYEITGSLSPGITTPRRVSIKYAFKLPAPGTLVVETTMRASATAEPTTVATVYKKSSEPVPAPDTTPKAVAALATMAQVEWFTGVWSGTTVSGRTTEERWLPASGGQMLATSRTLLASGSAVAFEFLCITERDGGLVYTAMPNAAAPTEFVLTKIDADSATFENPAHDFPKMIRYVRKPDGTMEATISGDAPRRPTTFVFKKQQ